MLCPGNCGKVVLIRKGFIKTHGNGSGGFCPYSGEPAPYKAQQIKSRTLSAEAQRWNRRVDQAALKKRQQIKRGPRG